MTVNRYPVKYLLFFLPFLAILCIEIFILPIHAFTFRIWESLIVKNSFGILKGPFYPNMEVSMVEEGSLAYRTPFAVKKDVVWITDRYGYRIKDTPRKHHPIMIVGDSNIAGSGLSQQEILSEILGKRLGVSVYPLSPERLRALYGNRIFNEEPPGLVIVESIERGIHDAKALAPLRSKEFQKPSRFSKIVQLLQLNGFLQKIAITGDRILKGNMLQYLRARINGKGPTVHMQANSPGCSVMFLQGSQVNRSRPVEQIDQIVERLKESKNVLNKKGIRFIFLPIPDKETIYSKCLGNEKPVFLEQLVQRLKMENVEVVDTLSAFEEVYQQRSIMLYHIDDDHWNAEGVKLAADLLERQIRQGGFSLH